MFLDTFSLIDFNIMYSISHIGTSSMQNWFCS